MTDPITLAVVNARVWTGDRAAPWAEALAVSGERLVAVGTNAEIRRAASAVTPIDAGGRLVLPGFIDTHVLRADFVMLDRNIFEVAPEEIGAVRVRLTIVGGRRVFDGTR